MNTIFCIEVVCPDRTIHIKITNEEFDALWPLLPRFQVQDPLEGKWDDGRDVREIQERMFGQGLIDCKGNVTLLGEGVCAAIFEFTGTDQDDDLIENIPVKEFDAEEFAKFQRSPLGKKIGDLYTQEAQRIEEKDQGVDK